jgi:hypothetical protein
MVNQFLFELNSKLLVKLESKIPLGSVIFDGEYEGTLTSAQKNELIRMRISC